MTNREIAQKLGISPAALSLIINHKPGVSDSTRDRAVSYTHLDVYKRQVWYRYFQKHIAVLIQLLHPNKTSAPST